MIHALALIVFAHADLVKPPKQPDIKFYWREVDLWGANEMKIRPVWYKDNPRWIRLYGVDVPSVGKDGYSGARQDLEILMGQDPPVYFEDENPDHPVLRNARWVQYVWVYGKLTQFELVRDGWAKVNDEGRKGRYGKFLVAAEDEAKRFHEGIWASSK